MDMRLFATVFATVFMAELGDKTQLATLLYAAEGQHPRWTVFLAAAAALVLTSALGVLAGGLVVRYVSPRVLSWVAGLGFIIIGIWTLARS
jgi:putative Ca2+/H+ antiporter (TMEM165/GDT1 family)